MDKDDKIFLEHIMESIVAIEDYTRGINENDFYDNREKIDAVVRNIEIIGEASNNLSADYKRNHGYIPWQDIVDMRNLLIHEYFGVDKVEVWKAVQQDIPELKKEIELLLKQ